MAEKQQRGNKEGVKLTTHPLPHATIRRLILSSIGGDKQLSKEALEVATNFWEEHIQTWAKDYLLKELQETNNNPNRTKSSDYRYKRITGLMCVRAIRKAMGED